MAVYAKLTYLTCLEYKETKIDFVMSYPKAIELRQVVDSLRKWQLMYGRNYTAANRVQPGRRVANVEDLQVIELNLLLEAIDFDLALYVKVKVKERELKYFYIKRQLKFQFVSRRLILGKF